MSKQYKDVRTDTVVATTAIVKHRFIARDGSQGSISGGFGASGPKAYMGVAGNDARIGEAVAVWMPGSTAPVECAGAVVAGSGLNVLPDGRVSNSGGAAYVFYAKQAGGVGSVVEVEITGIN